MYEYYNVPDNYSGRRTIDAVSERHPNPDKDYELADDIRGETFAVIRDKTKSFEERLAAVRTNMRCCYVKDCCGRLDMMPYKEYVQMWATNKHYAGFGKEFLECLKKGK